MVKHQWSGKRITTPNFANPELATGLWIGFELSDCASILDTASPHLVASALIAYKNRKASRTKNSVTD